MPIFLPSRSDLAWDTQDIRNLLNDYEIVFGTGSTHEAYLAALINQLTSNYHLLGAGCTEKEVEDLVHCASRPVLLVIVDSIANDSGVELAKRIRIKHPAMRSVLLVDNLEKTAREPDLKKAYDGLVSAGSIGRGGIAECIRKVLGEGEVFIDPTLINEFNKISTSEIPAFNQRELQILPLLAKGLKNKQIAQELYIAETTSRDYVSSILAKLQLPNRAAAAAWVIEQGLAH